MINVNLISERERQRKSGEIAGRIAFFVAVVAFVAVIAAVTVQQTRLRLLRASLKAIDGEIAGLQSQKNEIDVLQRQIDNKRPLVALLRAARDSEAKWCKALTDIAEALPEAVPPQVSVTTLRSSDNLQPRVKDQSDTSREKLGYEGFTIAGEAATGDLVGQFMTNLRNTDSFGDVYMQSFRRRARKEGEVFQFDIQALLAKERPAS